MMALWIIVLNVKLENRSFDMCVRKKPAVADNDASRQHKQTDDHGSAHWPGATLISWSGVAGFPCLPRNRAPRIFGKLPPLLYGCRARAGWRPRAGLWRKSSKTNDKAATHRTCNEAEYARKLLGATLRVGAVLLEGHNSADR